MQDATANYFHTELVEEPLRLELKYTTPPKHVTEFNVLVERMSAVAVDSFRAVGKNI